MNAQTAKITPGPWVAQKDPNAIRNDDWCIGVEGAPIDYVATCSERDADLIAQAGTVANETGLTPRQLADQRAELLGLLQELIDIEGPQPGTAEWANKVRAAIAKATGEQP